MVHAVRRPLHGARPQIPSRESAVFPFSSIVFEILLSLEHCFRFFLTMSAAPLPTRWPKSFQPDDVTAPVHGTVVRETTSVGSNVGEHHHRTGQLTIAVSGWVGLRMRSKVLALPPGTAAWVPAGTDHEGVLAKGSVSWYVHFSDALSAKLPKTVERIFLSPLATEAARRFLDRSAPFDEDSPEGRLALVLVDELLAARRLPTDFGTLSVHPLVRRVAEAIIEHPDMRVSRESYAGMISKSGRQLARIVTAQTGRSFADWRLELVLLHSTMLLQRGMTVEETAMEIGYSSPSAFIVAFKRIFGVTPGAYAGLSGREA